MFAAIQKASGARVALTNSAYNYATKLGAIKSFLSDPIGGGGGGGVTDWPDIPWFVVDEALSSSTAAAPPSSLTSAAPVSADSPAFLQFTSGSTSEPKGVVITHGNLAHNLDLIVTGLSADAGTVVVSWLPLYHDMGLIGSWLGALFCGGSGVYFSPAAFIRDPTLWVRLVSRHRGTHMQVRTSRS